MAEEQIEYKFGQLVEYKCACGVSKIMKYRRHRFIDWKCHHCAMVEGHKQGKFKINPVKMTDEVRAKIGAKASANWNDQEYREKWKQTRNTTRDTRSASSKAIWSDSDRLQQLSEKLVDIWKREDYRQIKTAQSQELWQNEEYKAKQKAGYTDKVRYKISDRARELWSDHEFRSMMISIFNSEQYRNNLITALSCPEYKDLQSRLNIERWKDEDFRRRMIEIFGSDEHRSKMVIINNEILSRPEVRWKLSNSSIKCWQNPEYRKRLAVARANQPRISSLQVQLYKYLDDLGVGYYKEGVETVIGYYAFDCLIPGTPKGILIECQGDYWHSLPKAVRNDKSKFTYIDRYFPQYEVMYLWEHEFYTKDRVLDRLKLKLGIGIETQDFQFSDIVIREPNSAELKTFLDSYHYIGKGRGGITFGAYLDDKLIACVVYSPPLRQNTASQFCLNDNEVRELSRFCIHPAYHKKNFATWFIAKTLSALQCMAVIAYSDKTVGHLGTIYKASNFQFHHTVSPDYWYVDESGYVMHKRTLYGKAKQMRMIESEYADKYAYRKIYGGEKLCFIKWLRDKR